MRIVVESFVVMANLFVLVTQNICLVKNALRTSFSTRSQRIHQLFFLLSVLFLVAYQYRLLKIRYGQQIWDFDNSVMTGKIKVLQYIAENLLRTVVLLSLDIIMSSIDKMKIFGIKDNAALRTSIFVYNLIRTVPIAAISIPLTGNVSFESFLMELFLIGEGTVIVLVFASLRKSLGKIQKELCSSFLPEKSYLEYLLGQYRSHSSMFVGSLIAETTSRVIFLFVMLEHRSKTLVFLRDLGNLLKIISIYVLIKSLNDLIFIDYNQNTLLYAKTDADQSVRSRFFVFEEDPDENTPELGKE